MKMGMIAVLGLMFSGFALVGCERELAREESVDIDDNTVQRESTVIRERSDGSIVKEETETKRDLNP